jgi:hypothetical protein
MGAFFYSKLKLGFQFFLYLLFHQQAHPGEKAFKLCLGGPENSAFLTMSILSSLSICPRESPIEGVLPFVCA